MPKFCVIIVNYNGGAYLQGAVDSLARQTLQDFEVIIVDNASSDGSFEALEVPGRKYHRRPQPENLGFAAGNNAAARETQAEWLALLNPDAEAAPDWLAQLANAIDRYPDVKSFACAQYSLEDPDRLDGMGDCYSIFGIPWRGGYGWPAYALPENDKECFSACGASAVYHRETFLAHGGFDEAFFCYCEDVDLGYRLRLAGERCVFLPEAIIRHAGSAISGRASDFSLYHGTRNRLWTYVKNTPLVMLLITFPGHLTISLANIIVRSIASRTLAPWKGLWAGLKGMTRTSCRSSVSLRDLTYTMSWNPFALLNRRPILRALKPTKANDDA